MLRVEPALFSNVIVAVQRTARLTGGAIRDLPGGVIIDGLQGVNSFGSEIADAQKEYQLGRVRTALERVKQIESHFNGISGRWNSTVIGLITSAKQGRQKLSIQKLNEVRTAQTKMQQLSGPASKALQDLVSALEFAVSMEGRETVESSEPSSEEASTSTSSDDEQHSTSEADRDRPEQPSSDALDDTPELDSLGRFASNYRFDAKLRVRRDENRRAHVVPRLEVNKFYFVKSFDPPRVVRLREILPHGIVFFDTIHSREVLIESHKLKKMLRRGMWLLVAKTPTT